MNNELSDKEKFEEVFAPMTAKERQARKVTIKHSNGRTETVATESKARDILTFEYPGAVFGDWQQSGYAPERMLVWDSEQSADNDDGQHAVAEMRKNQ